ncbi:MAG TPA: hypothetical protein VLD63_07925 [Anaerolineales bacterium]|nr:hypothetical protein [Anaerolineales bacterium]
MTARRYPRSLASLRPDFFEHRRIALLILAAMAAALACRAPAQATSFPSLTPTSLADAQDSAPPGWTVYRDLDHGFGFWYPADAKVTSATGEQAARIEFLQPNPTNVVEESLTVRVGGMENGCRGPLDLEFDPAGVESRDVELDGSAFVRQTHSGAAAGTAVLRVVYSTSRGSECVSLDFTLSTFDIANLDPTHFPNPPASIDPAVEQQLFEEIAASLRWLP